MKPSKKENWLKLHYSQDHLKVPFMLYIDFESILNLVDDQDREHESNEDRE